jgi:hypothetical protein
MIFADMTAQFIKGPGTQLHKEAAVSLAPSSTARATTARYTPWLIINQKLLVNTIAARECGGNFPFEFPFTPVGRF